MDQSKLKDIWNFIASHNQNELFWHGVKIIRQDKFEGNTYGYLFSYLLFEAYISKDTRSEFFFIGHFLKKDNDGNNISTNTINEDDFEILHESMRPLFREVKINKIIK